LNGASTEISQFLFSRRNSIIFDSLSNIRKNATHCSHFPSLRCSTNLAVLALRNFRQGFRLGELRRTANCSSVKLWLRFLRGIAHPSVMQHIIPRNQPRAAGQFVLAVFFWAPLIAKGPLPLAAPIMIVKRSQKRKYIGESMRTFTAATLVIGLLSVLPASSQQQQPQTNPAQAPTDVAKPSPNSPQPDVDKGKDSTIVFFR